jgi:hypothetical protein
MGQNVAGEEHGEQRLDGRHLRSRKRMTRVRGGSETASLGEDLEVTHHEEHLRLEFRGTFTPAAAMQVVDAMIAQCLEADCTRVLLDCRSMGGRIEVVDRFEVAEYGATRLRSVRVAVLGRADQILPDRFFEKVAVNRGLKLKVFTDSEAAEDWLRG